MRNKALRYGKLADDGLAGRLSKVVLILILNEREIFLLKKKKRIKKLDGGEKSLTRGYD